MSSFRSVCMALLLLGVLQAICGCSKKQEVSPALVSGEQSKSGAMLAYEHTLRIKLPEAKIADRLAAARQACESDRFGACNVLRIRRGKEWDQAAAQVRYRAARGRRRHERPPPHR